MVCREMSAKEFYARIAVGAGFLAAMGAYALFGRGRSDDMERDYVREDRIGVNYDINRAERKEK